MDNATSSKTKTTKIRTEGELTQNLLQTMALRELNELITPSRTTQETTFELDSTLELDSEVGSEENLTDWESEGGGGRRGKENEEA